MLRDAPTTFWRWTFRRLFFYQGHLREKNLSIPAAAEFLSLDASSGLLATASAPAPAMFLALGSRPLVVLELYDMRDKKKQKKNVYFEQRTIIEYYSTLFKYRQCLSG